MKSGTFQIQAQEQIAFCTPAPEAVVAEADYFSADRIFVTSTRSLVQLPDDPLQRIQQALGDRHAGTFSSISSIACSPLRDWEHRSEATERRLRHQ